VLLWLILIFVTLPLIELSLLLRVSRVIEFWPTIGLIVFTGALGAFLARRQGMATWRRVQNEMREGKVPTGDIVDALLIFIAGVVLVTPGLITDLFGFLLLVPPFRKWMKRRLADHFQARLTIVNTGFGPAGTAGAAGFSSWTEHVNDQNDVIDVEVTDVRDVPKSRLSDDSANKDES
jgi:UPF0716 protein FxsA